jgi:hypothetical protein
LVAAVGRIDSEFRMAVRGGLRLKAEEEFMVVRHKHAAAGIDPTGRLSVAGIAEFPAWSGPDFHFWNVV